MAGKRRKSGLTALEELASVAGPALARGLPPLSHPILLEHPQRGIELGALLAKRNGFYAFDAALHVFPAGIAESGTMDLDHWNAPTLWRDAYGELAKDCVFFAEDIFGGQFCLWGKAVYFFEPETGEREVVASTLEGWAGLVLDEYAALLGWPLAHTWQLEHGALLPGKRLVPKKPFVLGGEYALDNLQVADAVEAMRLRGSIALQIKDMPDGTKVSVKGE